MSVSSVAVSLCFCSGHTSGGVLCTPAQPRAISTLSAKSHLNEELLWCLLMFAVSLNMLWLSAETCPFIAALTLQKRGLQRRTTLLFRSLSGMVGLLDDFHWAKHCQSETNVWKKCHHKSSIDCKLLCAPPPTEQSHGNLSTPYRPLPKRTVSFTRTQNINFLTPFHVILASQEPSKSYAFVVVQCVVVCGATVPPIVRNLQLSFSTLQDAE